MKKVIIM